MEKVGSKLDLTEWQDALTTDSAMKIRGAATESLGIFIKAQGTDPDKTKSILKKDAREDRPFTCEVAYFTYK